MKSNIVIILVLILNISCKKENSIIDSKLENQLLVFSEMIYPIDTLKLKKISTKKGFESFKFHSNYFESIDFLKTMSKNLKKSKENVFSKYENDSIIILSMGKEDVIVGATKGALKLKMIDDVVKIDGFLAGK